MNKNDYKKAIEKIEPEQGFKERLEQSVLKKRESRFQRGFIASICVGFLLIISVWIFGLMNQSETPDQMVAMKNTDSIFISKMKLPKQSNAAADMIGLIVYQGRIYTQTDSSIRLDASKQILGEKIGRTKGNIDEWSSQAEYSKELASSIGQIDVFTVKGYDSHFRIMTYDDQFGANFYECLNGIEVKNGADLLNRLNVIGNVQSASWEKFDSWNNNKQQFENLQVDETLAQFLMALNAAKPIDQETLSNEGIYEKKAQKFILLKLQDQIEVQLRLFEGGYVKYGFMPVFFKVDDKAFLQLWNRLE